MVWKMSFDIRYRSYIFKHSLTEKPEMDDPLFSEHFHTSAVMPSFCSSTPATPSTRAPCS